MSKLTTARESLLLAEYQHLSEAIFKQQAMRWEWQKFGMIGTFGVYAILFSAGYQIADQDVRRIISFLPLPLNLLGAIMSFGIRWNIVQLGKGICKIETELDCADVGWELGRAKLRDDGSELGWFAKFLLWPVSKGVFLFWISMIAISTTAPLVLVF